MVFPLPSVFSWKDYIFSNMKAYTLSEHFLCVFFRPPLSGHTYLLYHFPIDQEFHGVKRDDLLGSSPIKAGSPGLRHYKHSCRFDADEQKANTWD